MENDQGNIIPDLKIEANEEIELAAKAEDEPMIKKLKKEMECPVCYQIPTSLPIPTCSRGHIVCTECKKKIPFSRNSEKPCPICSLARLTVKAYPKACYEGFLAITARYPLFC